MNNSCNFLHIHLFLSNQKGTVIDVILFYFFFFLQLAKYVTCILLFCLVPLRFDVFRSRVNETLIIQLLHMRLIWLYHLFADIVLLSIRIIFFLSGIVQVSVEIKELSPCKIYFINMSMHLLTHIHKVLTTQRIIKHDYSTRLFPALVGKVCRFLSQILHFFCFFWQHHFKSGFLVINCILGLTKFFFFDLPF